MERATKIDKNDIIFFQESKELENYCLLKYFIHFLHSIGIKRPLNFSYVEENGPLIDNLTLKENILLESIPNGLSSTKEFQLYTYLKRTGNIYLINLFNKIKHLEEYPKNTDIETRKITALFRGLVRKADYIMLERPEKHLSEQNFLLFINAMTYQIKNRPQMALINSSSFNPFMNLVSKIVYKDQSEKFIISQYSKPLQQLSQQSSYPEEIYTEIDQKKVA